MVESLLTQTLIIHVIRTNRIPFLQSRASWPMVVTTAAIMLAGVWLPTSPLAEPLGLVPLPWSYWPLLLLTLLCYVVLTQGVKILADPQALDLRGNSALICAWDMVIMLRFRPKRSAPLCSLRRGPLGETKCYGSVVFSR